MKKNYIALAMLLAASPLNSMGAKTEAEFKSAKTAAMAKVTSWSFASPYAPDALSKGLADLENTVFSSYPDGDAAVKAVDDIVASTLSAAREELRVKMPTIFVTITTDALTASPVDGGSLVGTPYENRLYNVEFKTYSKACQGSAWLIYEQATNPGKYGMRNNVIQYVNHKVVEDTQEYELMVSFSCDMQPDISVDFADNGKMEIKCDDLYIGTDSTGSLAYFDEFSPATSWTLTRAYDEKHDLPRVSTEDDPVWYVFRSAAAPDAGFLTARYPEYRSMILGPLCEATMWRFGPNDVIPNAWVFAHNKTGSMIIMTPSGHGECNQISAGYPYMEFGVIDGYEEHGLAVCVTNQQRLMNFNDLQSPLASTGCPYLLTKAPGKFSNQYEIDLSWLRPEFPEASSFWFIEEAGDAGLMDFLDKRTKYAGEVAAYLQSQPWGHEAISAEADRIRAVEYSDYPSAEEAIAAIRSMADSFLATIPSLMLSEASAAEAYFSLNNARRMSSGSGWMISTDEEGVFTTLSTNLAGNGSTWSIEKKDDTSFCIKNLDGYYIGAIRSGQAAKSTTDAASAALFSFVLSDGRVVLKSTRSCLGMDDADGVLTALAADDAGAKWVLRKVVVMEENDLVTSDISDQWLYTITSVSEPLVYLESEGHRFYCYARGYLSELSYWFLEDITNGDGGYRFVSSINAADGIRMCRNPLDDNGNFNGPVCYDKTLNDPKWSVENWFVVPVEYDGKTAYQILTCYPPKGNCAISRQMTNGVMHYSTVDDLENTAWYFNHVEGIDHEGMFNNTRASKLPDLEAFINVQPFAQDYLKNARDYVANASMTDFGPDYYSSNSALIKYVDSAVEKAKWILEDEPRGCAVRFSNVRRAGNGSPSYLAAVDGHANTVDLTDSEAERAATWTLEYYTNGCYRLKNDNGGYLGKLSADIEIVGEPSQAGLYFLDFRNYYMTVADRNNPGIGINVDQSGSDVCVYDSNDAGSRWTIELARPSGVDAIAGESDGEAEYYDLNGLRVSPAELVPGLYIQRRGNRVSKVLVK